MLGKFSGASTVAISGMPLIVPAFTSTSGIERLETDGRVMGDCTGILLELITGFTGDGTLDCVFVAFRSVEAVAITDGVLEPEFDWEGRIADGDVDVDVDGPEAASLTAEFDLEGVFVSVIEGEGLLVSFMVLVGLVLVGIVEEGVVLADSLKVGDSV
mmetsp:Transcript_13398/g.16868  ORF Transcript_13398/g.16868 Transcript_13398/m.16868 type:complete len:158 (-) Transcript_13398:472-945(-)